MQLSIVLPCYNEEANIRTTVQEVLAWCVAFEGECEVIVVNDGSGDKTADILSELASTHDRLRIVHREQNGGYGVAVRAGCDSAVGEWIAFMDSDGQFRIGELSHLLPHLESHAFVTGRRQRRADPPARVLYGKVLAFFNLALFRLWIRDVNCGLKVFRRDTWATIRPEYGIEKLFNTEMFLRLKQAGIPWKQVSVPHYPRRAGMPTGASGRALKRMMAEVRALRRQMK